MKHTIYEDPRTHRFAWIVVPPKFVDGDKLPIPACARWFNTREEVMAAAPDLFALEECEVIED